MSRIQRVKQWVRLFVIGATIGVTATSPVSAEDQNFDDVSRRVVVDQKATKAAFEFAEKIAGGKDSEEYYRVLLDTLQLLQQSQNRRAADELEKEIEKDEALLSRIEQRRELLRSLRSSDTRESMGSSAESARLQAQPDPAFSAESRGMPEGAPVEIDDGFAPRAGSANSLATGTRSFGGAKKAVSKSESQLFWMNDDWKKNAEIMIKERGLGATRQIVKPRIFNPNDNENQPTKDLPDCVSIGQPGRSCCTGTLIRADVVLTAAHCEPCRPSHVYVGWNANRPQANQLYRIARVVRHRQYNPDTHANDICLIFLADPIPANVAQPRELATTKDITSARSFLAVGFGKTDQGNSGIKLEAPVAVKRIYNKELVAGGLGFDTCQGDSGGPIYFEPKDSKRFRLAGVTSRGEQCGTGGIYVRVDAYRTWIESTIGSPLRSSREMKGTPTEQSPAYVPEKTDGGAGKADARKKADLDEPEDSDGPVILPMPKKDKLKKK